jgi:alcohol dehydrogenase (cytochrome c)
MRQIRKFSGIAVLAGASAAAIAASAFAAEYSMTVNRDRLINAQNEPQNWLMMNGDYGSMRYSKLTQFNRDNVKNLRMVWALALGGMQDVGQNGPENEVNPLIDNGFMYTTDGWGTVYKIDARNPNKGEFVWISDSGVRHEGNVPRTRGIALWDDLVIANLPDGRVIAINRDRRDRLGQAGRQTERIRQQGEIPHRPDHRRGQGSGRQRRGRRADPRLARGARRQDRQRALALVCRAQARRPRQRDLEGQDQRLEDRRRRAVADRILRPLVKAHGMGHRQSGSDLRPAGAAGRQSLHQSAVALDIESGKLAWYFQYTPNDLWDYDENGIHLLYDTTINGENRKAVAHFGRNGSSTRSIAPTAASSGAGNTSTT